MLNPRGVPQGGGGAGARHRPERRPVPTRAPHRPRPRPLAIRVSVSCCRVSVERARGMPRGSDRWRSREPPPPAPRRAARRDASVSSTKRRDMLHYYTSPHIYKHPYCHLLFLIDNSPFLFYSIL